MSKDFLLTFSMLYRHSFCEHNVYHLCLSGSIQAEQIPLILNGAETRDDTRVSQGMSLFPSPPIVTHTNKHVLKQK